MLNIIPRQFQKTIAIIFPTEGMAFAISSADSPQETHYLDCSLVNKIFLDFAEEDTNCPGNISHDPLADCLFYSNVGAKHYARIQSDCRNHQQPKQALSILYYLSKPHGCYE